MQSGSDYQQSFFRDSNRLPWQLDHVFAYATPEAKTTPGLLTPTPAVGDEPCSDHAPIVVDIAV